MRTTLTLDEDISAKLKEESRRSGKPFKQVVNDCLRVGLNVRSQSPPRPPFKVKARSLGSKDFNYDNVWELIAQIEGPYYR